MTDILSATGVSFRQILKYSDICIPVGQATFLRGSSGSGKSTLLRLFNGTLSPDAGEIRYGGQPVAELDRIFLRREVLLAGQAVFLFPGTIADNFRAFYRYREAAMPEVETIERYLRLCGLPVPPEAVCDSMSGGERQRVFLALHLSFEPKVLLLDEPTSALDDATGRGVLENLKAYLTGDGRSLVVVSHADGLADELADQIVPIDGRAGA